MISFKQFIKNHLNEGGNVTISTQSGNVSADKIDLTKTNRDAIAVDILTALHLFNSAFKQEYNVPIWNDELFSSKKFLSGSSLHFLNKNIP